MAGADEALVNSIPFRAPPTKAEEKEWWPRPALEAAGTHLGGRVPLHRECSKKIWQTTHPIQLTQFTHSPSPLRTSTAWCLLGLSGESLHNSQGPTPPLLPGA
jgi:hypothetical protein